MQFLLLFVAKIRIISYTSKRNLMKFRCRHKITIDDIASFPKQSILLFSTLAEYDFKSDNSKWNFRNH